MSSALGNGNATHGAAFGGGRSGADGGFELRRRLQLQQAIEPRQIAPVQAVEAGDRGGRVVVAEPPEPVGAFADGQLRLDGGNLRGVFDVTIDGVTTKLSAGGSYIVAPNLIHGVVALEKGLLIDTFTPRRDEFLA